VVIYARVTATRDLAVWQQPAAVATSEDARVPEVRYWH